MGTSDAGAACNEKVLMVGGSCCATHGTPDASVVCTATDRTVAQVRHVVPLTELLMWVQRALPQVAHVAWVSKRAGN
jgi:hypothetical protein